ncbi:hypothetical protein F5878DRAFT_664842 [Lentinula raphanica]|uniref:Uncharacterized protein n=1 Tax=Lentinula raphanica TaxID=153919 RepID=A0AA38U8X3_9AGAR|nr:hypothetical protein F5878DRAFT_664842 [Lentinula raphanica]
MCWLRTIQAMRRPDSFVRSVQAVLRKQVQGNDDDNEAESMLCLAFVDLYIIQCSPHDSSKAWLPTQLTVSPGDVYFADENSLTLDNRNLESEGQDERTSWEQIDDTTFWPSHSLVWRILDYGSRHHDGNLERSDDFMGRPQDQILSDIRFRNTALKEEALALGSNQTPDCLLTLASQEQ